MLLFQRKNTEQDTEEKQQTTLHKKIMFLKYQTISYNIVGKRVLKNRSFNNLNSRLKMAAINMTAGVYLSLMIVTGILSTIIAFLLSTLVFLFLLHSPNALLFIFIITIVTGMSSFGFFPFLLRSKISSRRINIDQELPFVLSELSILASTGLTPIKIIRRIAQRDEIGVSHEEFKKIIYKIDIDGKDIITALSETAKDSPSSLFRETLWDLSNMIHQGGDLDEYLRKKADSTMQLKRDIQKEFIEQLGTYSEIYITLVLVGILMIAIGAFLMDVMGSNVAGLTPDSLLMILAYGLVPIVVIAINVIVSSAYSKSG